MPEDVEKKLEEQQPKCMSRCRIMKNLVITCLGFFLLFSAFQSYASLLTTINQQGSTSQSVIYAAFAVSSLLFPKLLISKLGCKYTMLVSIASYIPFMVSNYYREFLPQFLTSMLLGLGGATLWSSACTYINEISALYSSQGTEPVDLITTRFFGIFFMIFQNSQIWGNLVSFYVLRTADNDVKVVTTGGLPAVPGVNITATCGINFCGEISESLSQLPDQRRFMLITVYLVFTVLSAVVIAFFLDQLHRSSSEKESNVLFSRLTATLKHLRKPNQILMVPITIFMGVEQAFILSDYSQGYIACSWGIKNVSLVFICYGVVNAIASFFAGRFSKYVPRVIILLVGMVGNVLACAIMFLWDPGSRNILYFFITVGLWGMSDAIWQTIINSMYGILFRKDEEAAFGNLRLWEAIGFFIPYFFNKRLCMPSKLYLVLGVLAAGIVGCIIVEVVTFVKSRIYCVARKK